MGCGEISAKVDFFSYGREPFARLSFADRGANAPQTLTRRSAKSHWRNEMSQTNPVPLAVLLPVLGRLSQPERIFVARYLSTGDKFDAAHIAYPRCKSAKAIQIRALQVLGRKKVVRVLALHSGRNDAQLNLEIALADTRRIVKRALRRNSGNEKLTAPLNRMLDTLARIAGEKSNG
jgi:hypothetical protein